MKWRVQVDGDAFDLREFEKCLDGNELRIVHDESKAEFFLEASGFAKMATDAEVLSGAARALTILTGIARMKFGARTPLTVGAVHERKADGTEMIYLRFHDTVHARSTMDTLAITDEDGINIELPTIDPARDWITAAYSDGAVEKALRLYGADGHDWVGLYRVFEVIKDDIGSLEQTATLCGVAQGRLKAFTHTANSPAAVGDLARHGTSTAAPPANPMTLSEAQALIDLVLHGWIQYKAGSSGARMPSST